MASNPASEEEDENFGSSLFITTLPTNVTVIINIGYLTGVLFREKLKKKKKKRF